MATTRQPIDLWRVIVSSPSDVVGERESVSRAVETVNAVLEVSKKNFRLRLYKWETDVPPGPHPSGGQGRIESHLNFEECELLIGIFWKRFGTPTLGSGSGTEREIDLAYGAWKERQRPAIMLFFNSDDYLCRTVEECDQLQKVLIFKEKWQSRVLSGEYHGAPDFERVITKYLLIECLGTESASSALRSQLSCRVMCSPVAIRGEGLAERVGDLKLLFDGFPASSSTAETSLEVDIKFNTDLAWPVGATGPTLVVDSESGVTIRIEGVRLDRNTVRFRGVPHSRAIMTIVNLRVDALRIAIATPFSQTQLHAYVEVRSGLKEVPTTDPLMTVAIIRLGMNFSIDWSPGSTATRFSRTAGINSRISGTRSISDAPRTFAVRFSEGFAGAFKNRTEETGVSVYHTTQIASSGTRLMITLTNVPDGVAIYVATHDTPNHANGETCARLVQTQAVVTEPANSLLSSSFAIPRKGPGAPFAQLKIRNQTATAVWEWISTQPALLDTPRNANMDVILLAEPDGATVGVATITGSFAPLIIPWKTTELGSPLVPSFGIYQAARIAFYVE